MSINEFKRYPANPRFLISKAGLVVDTDPGKISKNSKLCKDGVFVGQKRSNGYYAVKFRENGKQKHILVHRMIAETFISAPPFMGALARHLDDDKTNNNLSNIAWGSRQDNSNDAVKNKRIPWRGGELHPTSKITEDEALDIKMLMGFGASYRDVANAYSLTSDTIYKIRKGSSWSHLRNYFNLY